MSIRRAVLLCSSFAFALVLVACAINPATGKREFVLIGEQQEIAIGEENDKAIGAQLGLYDDPALQAYVQQLGARLAASSERPGLEWTFRVVDDPVVNAFALPGGYIYVTRGILAHFENEAELAGVVGHEIGHVTARHGVSQMTKAQLAQLGLGLGAVLAPEQMERFGSLVQTGLSVLFLRYSRDDERQADDLGLRYMTRSGYDPRQMPGVFDMLGRVSAAAGGDRLPGWLSTHPLPENREQRIEAQIAELGGGAAARPSGHDEYVSRLDSLVFGEDPREGYFKDGEFFHPVMRLRMRFPDGWELSNRKTAVAGVSPGRDGAIQLTLASERTAAAALDSFLGQAGVERTEAWSSPVRGLGSAGAAFSVAQEGGTIDGVVAFVEYGDRVFQLVGYALENAWSGLRGTISGSISSFRSLTDRKALEVQPRRVRIVKPPRSMTLEEFAERYDATVPLDTLALLNRLDAGERLVAGRPYKVVQGGE